MWRLLRPLLFRFDAERIHYAAMTALTVLFALPGVRRAARAWLCVRDSRLARDVLGATYELPVGLAAGFDKNARWYNDLLALGFGSVEVGTCTGQPQPGNERPRLFRLPADRALLNRFGFNNDGADAVAARLAHHPPTGRVGVNIGKSRVVPNEEALSDYLHSLEQTWEHAAYIAVNVSSPNTAGLRDLQEQAALRHLLGGVLERAAALASARGVERPPVLVKIAPDLDDDAIDAVVDLALELGLDGIIATNTTIVRDGLRTEGVDALGAGGVSGRPLTLRSRAVVARVRRRAGPRLTVIGAGGVFDADDAWEMIRHGADLVQMYTGFIYEGPFALRRIHRALLDRLDREGLPRLEALRDQALAPIEAE